MRKPIKFRVWDGERMIPPDFIDRDGFAHWGSLSLHQKMSKEMMQSTGLLDETGKEIYEEDVMEFYSAMAAKGTNPIIRKIVKWNARHCAFEGCFNGKVIGNIFENPELLKGESK